MLGFAMACSAALILYTAHGQGFAVDELFYYGRVADKQGDFVHYSPFSPEYLLAPFNGHLPLGGRFVYELVFATVGAEYTVLVLINIAALLAVVALVFELIRHRVGNIAALAPCVVLLFLGFAREQLLWPLDFNTAGSLAAGLGAVLIIQRESRRGDILACLFLVLSAAMIELGLSFALGIAAWLVLSHRRAALRRAWIVAVPIVLYAAWYIWSQHVFGQSEGQAGNIDLIPETMLHGAAAALGSLTGTNPILPGSYGGGVTWFGRALAVVAAVALLARIWGRGLPRTIWVWLLVLGSYWSLLGLAARPAEASRYILVAAVLIVLIAADAVRRRLPDAAAVVLLVLAAVALPANIVQLTEGRADDVLHHDPPISSTEFAMLELAGPNADPEYVPMSDARVAEVDGGLFIGIEAGAYLDAAADNGSAAYSLDQVRQASEELRLIADATLVGALGIEPEPAGPAGRRANCEAVPVEPGRESAIFRIGPGRTLLRPRDGGSTALWLSRFADSDRSVGIGYLRPDRWASLEVPADAAADAWRAAADGAVTACRPR